MGSMKRWFLPVLLLLLGFGFGCGKKRPLPAPPVSQPPTAMESAEQLFESGNLEKAFRAYEEVLNDPRTEPVESDRARFRMGIILADPEHALFNPEKSIEYLSGVSGSSNDGDEAKLLVALLKKLMAVENSLQKRQKELARVSGELEKLKAVDQKRRKRRNP